MNFLTRSLLTACFVTLSATALAQGNDPFRPEAVYADGVVSVTFTMTEADQHIYDDMLACSLGAPASKPAAGKDADQREIYEGLATFTWAVQPGQSFTLDYQGCDDEQCYMPQTVTFTIRPDGSVTTGAADETPATPSTELSLPTVENPLAAMSAEPLPATTQALFEEEPVATAALQMRVCSGFIPEKEFIAFLIGEEQNTKQAKAVKFFDSPVEWVEQHGFWLLIVLVFVFGIALNLTPCVLPMMPINLAIIGAGAAGGSRAKGALRGGAYGLGIALAYGVLTLIPVLTGSAFGTLQATWWFNAAIAVIFVLLALALLDVFMIDFTRFSNGNNGKQGTVAAFVAGAVSAILAGACVAPILIAVLLLTSHYWGLGDTWALCLPFVLGLGMAAPWPIAGAGLSFLPKPGAWMMWVKKIFAVIVFLFAAHYGWTAVKTLLPHEGLDGANYSEIEAAVNEALDDGTPVLLDFWGPACKACDKMEATTFKNADVMEELKRFKVLKVRMDLADRNIQSTLEHYPVKGLPTFIVIEPTH